MYYNDYTAVQLNKKTANFLFERIKPFRKKLKMWEYNYLRDINYKIKNSGLVTDVTIDKLYQINRCVRKRSGIKKEKFLI